MIIRREPADFVVREKLTEQTAHEVRAGGPHAVYELTKTSLSTPEASARLCAALRVKQGTASHAGLKDKHAVTVQFISVPLRGDAPQTLEGPGWNAKLTGGMHRAIAAADIERNAFTITIRAMNERDTRVLRSRAGAFAATPRPKGVPDGPLILNAFGEQRFGSARHGEGFAGKRLLAGDFEGALRLLIATPARKDTGARRGFTRAAAAAWGDWAMLAAHRDAGPYARVARALAEGTSFKDAFGLLPHIEQQMAVEAYQSWLWNAAARELARECGAWFASTDAYGGMLFPYGPGVPHGLVDAMMPMPGEETSPAPPWGEAMGRVLAAEGLRFGGLSIPGLRRPAFRSSMRPLFVVALGMQFGEIQPDETASARSPNRHKLLVSFELPRGSYATTVLKALGQA